MDEDGVEQPQKQRNPAEHLAAFQYKKGMTGNPHGRPIGAKSLKQYLKEKFERMTDDERETYLEGIDKKFIFEMAEGKPKQDLDIDATMHGPDSINLNT